MKSNLAAHTLFSFLVFITVLYTVIPTAEARISTVTKFDGYLKLLKATPKYKERLRIVKAVWGQIRAESVNDLDIIAQLYEQLPDFSSINSNDEDDNESVDIKLKHKQAADELKQVMRRYLVQRISKLLANALSGPVFYDSKKVAKFCDTLLDKYDYELVVDAYQKAIKEVYNAISTEILAARLLSIYRVNDERSFTLMWTLQLYLFWHFAQYNDVNDVYLYNFANYVHTLQQTDYYQKLDKKLQEETEKAITKLPSSMRHFLFSKNFSLRNEYYSEYFYTTDKIMLDDFTRATFTWNEKNITNNQFSWFHNITQSFDVFEARSNLKFHLISELIKTHLYFVPVVKNYTDVVGAWEPINLPPSTSEWNLQLIEEKLIFKQGDYVMCANSTLYDTQRRFVVGVKALSEQKKFDKSCQWTAYPFALS